MDTLDPSMSAYTLDDDLPVPQRRIRHISSLQIRNLTPFPARDALAQTLTQQGPSSSLLPPQPADDIDLTLASRRRRRVSSTSIATLLDLEAEDEGGPGSTGTLRKNRSASNGSSQSIRHTLSGSGASTIRPRARTSSKTSSAHLSPASPFNTSKDLDPPNERGGISAGGHFVTHSQRALEKIVSSRLVETFVTLTLPLTPSSSSQSASQASSAPTSPSATAISRKGKDAPVKRVVSASVANHRRGASSSSSTSTLSAASSSRTSRPQSLTLPSPKPSRRRPGSSGGASASSSKAANFPSPPPTPPPPNSLLRHTPGVPGRKPERNEIDPPPSPLATPFYMSPPHLPSTNPRFSHLDPEREFAPWADLSGTHVKVAIWGRPPNRAPEGGNHAKGKGKETASASISSATHTHPPLKVLEEWEVDLDDMEPLSPDVAAHHLPSNTLLLTLSSGQTFQISPVSSLTSPESRAVSPLGHEYNSDGDVDELRRRRWKRSESDSRKRERETLAKSLRETRMKRSAGWQDLVKMVNLQTCIVDTQESLEEVVRTCDLLTEGDGYNASLREYSERQDRVLTLRAERGQVLQSCVEVQDAIEARRQALQTRRDTLNAARSMHDKGLHELMAQAQEVGLERRRHASLVASLPALRASLIQAVSFAFPIEPLSAPDLLFTILGAPLPIPISPSDPAPPLSLSSHGEVTDDTTATALGYVAQVVQLLSAYLGKGLVYPVTCFGSRSVIKDPISAMMGPRMFPLYSRGVETYRFEYGVFLLNKDIEMLMMDRNLRAMDMRHTLPNLKNLLLTLTTGDSAKPTRRFMSPTVVTALASGLRSPTRAISPLALEVSQPESQDETPTQTATSAGLRKSTPFLSPLAAILRARYPSSAGRPTVKVVDETPEPAVEVDGGTVAEPEQPNDATNDVHSPSGDTETKVMPKSNGKPHTRENGSPFEKLVNVAEPPTPPPPLPNVT